MGKERILVVDDELDNRVMMRYFLESWGYEVELASDGKEALDKVEADPPHLVLLDLEMPVMNGFEACQRLKSNPATEQIPVIMFTGLEKTADKVDGIRRGADDYVVKTVDPEELQARIEMILRRSRRYDAPAPAPAPAAPAPPQEEKAVSGSLSELYFPEAMQLILAYGKSGVLHLQDGAREGRVYLREGQVIHAQYNQMQGEEAFYALALWKSGRFSFEVGDPSCEATINRSGTNLLIEATRRLDEWNLISSKIPSFDMVPERCPLEGADSFQLTRQDWSVLRHIDGRQTIKRIAEKLQLDLFETGRVVFGLLTVGVIRFPGDTKERDASREIVPELAPDIQGEEPFRLSALQWRILSFVDGHRTVAVLSPLVGAPIGTLWENLKELIGRGFVKLKRLSSSGSQPRSAAPAGARNPGTPAQSNVEAFRPRARAINYE